MNRNPFSNPTGGGKGASAGNDRPGNAISMSPTRVIVTPVATPVVHPLSKRDVQRVLSVLPAGSVRDLRSVSLLGEMWTSGGYPVFVSYRKQGFIRLHAVSCLAWRVRSLRSTQVADLLRYGAHVDAGPSECVVTWTNEALRLFYTVGVLLPGVARHRREIEGAAEPGSIVRSLEDDHGTWQISDLALDHWRRFLRDGDLHERSAAS
jgi:hypothetical protein